MTSMFFERIDQNPIQERKGHNWWLLKRQNTLSLGEGLHRRSTDHCEGRLGSITSSLPQKEYAHSHEEVILYSHARSLFANLPVWGVRLLEGYINAWNGSWNITLHIVKYCVQKASDCAGNTQGWQRQIGSRYLWILKRCWKDSK